jgi:hypothetical protein
MLCSFTPYRFSALANPVPPRFTSDFFLRPDYQADGLSYLIASASLLAARVILAWNTVHDLDVADYLVHYKYASGHEVSYAEARSDRQSCLNPR